MDYDLIIVGSGPAGYVAAIRAAQTGMKTALVEKKRLGGMCLNWGCIPTKSLLESAQFYKRVQNASAFGIDGVDKKNLSFNWLHATQRAGRFVNQLGKGIEGLLKKNNAQCIFGEAAIVSPNSVKVGNEVLQARHIFIATGSRPSQEGCPSFSKKVIGIEELLAMESIPENFVLVGEGSVAMETAQMLRFIGKKVAIVMARDRFLPQLDSYLANYAVSRLQKDGVSILAKSSISEEYEGGVVVDGKKIPCDLIVNCNLRQAVLPQLEVSLEKQDGFLKVDDYFQTSIPTIFAIGDVNGKSSTAHAASIQGLSAVNYLQGIREKMDFNVCPINIYTSPEIAQVGKTEAQIKALGIDYKAGEFPLAANSKALIEGDREGFVRVLADAKYGEVLGVQIVSSHATDMISEAVIILQMEGTLSEISRIMHAHPTTSEVFTETALKIMGKPIHI